MSNPNARYIDLAVRYAQVRWRWDDISNIEERCENHLACGGLMTPVELVDDVADECRFDDPLDPWANSREVQDAIRKEAADLLKEAIELRSEMVLGVTK